MTRGGGRVGEELAEVGPSAAKARPASADATLEERLGEGQLSRKGQERRPASNEGGSRGGAEGKGDVTRPSSSEEADEGRSFLAPPATDLKGEDNEAEELAPRVGALLPQAGFNRRRATSAPTTPARPADESCVSGELGAAPQRETVGDDFQPAVEAIDGQVEVTQAGVVGSHPCPSFTADPSSGSLKAATTAPQNPGR